MPSATYRIGYSPIWRVLFLVMGIYLIVAAAGMVAIAVMDPAEGLAVPVSLLVIAMALGLYMLPLVRVHRQELTIDGAGLSIAGERSTLHLPWSAVASVRLNPVMPLMPYVVVALADTGPLVRFLDDNPRCFLAVWTRHVRVLRRYPWLVRKLFRIPAKLTTATSLDWLVQRYGGAIVIDGPAAGWRQRALHDHIAAGIARHARVPASAAAGPQSTQGPPA